MRGKAERNILYDKYEKCCLNMKIICFIAIRKKSLMSLIIENLISISGSRYVSFDSETGDLDELIGGIKKSLANVIVLEKSGPFTGDNAIARLLAVFANSVVIIVSEDSNKFSVIRKEEIILASSSDLMNIFTSIQSANLRNH